MNPGARPPGYGPWFHHLGAVQPRASFLNTLCLGFLIYTLEIRAPSSRGCFEDRAVGECGALDKAEARPSGPPCYLLCFSGL